MSRAHSQFNELQASIRDSLLSEWSEHGFFACYGSIDVRGDTSLALYDVTNSIRAPLPAVLKASMLLCWPLRLARRVWPERTDGVSLRVATAGPATTRFHTLFTDAFMYFTGRDILRDPRLAPAERAQWRSVLLALVQSFIEHPIACRVDGQRIPAYQFFPPRVHGIRGHRPADLLFRAVVINDMADCDDTFLILEVLQEFTQSFPQWAIAADGDEAQVRILVDRAVSLLDQPYWRLARAYQYQPHGVPNATFNCSDLDPLGGVTSFFGTALVEVPDPTANVNVLRSFLCNFTRWTIDRDPEALYTAQGIVKFLGSAVRASTFSSNRGHTYYIPEFFCAMAAFLWDAFQGLPSAAQRSLDPDGQLAVVRAVSLDYVRSRLDSTRGVINPFDAALGILALTYFRDPDERLIRDWLRTIVGGAEAGRHPFGAYEVFKGKLPVRVAFGSPALTAAFVYRALVAAESALGRERVDAA